MINVYNPFIFKNFLMLVILFEADVQIINMVIYVKLKKLKANSFYFKLLA